MAKASDNTVQGGVMHKDVKKQKPLGNVGVEDSEGGSKSERAAGRNAASACVGCHLQ